MKPIIPLLLAALTFVSLTPSPPTKLKAYYTTIRSIVQLQFPMEDGRLATCTGFVISASKGWILTARHCAPPQTEIFVNSNEIAKVIKTSDTLALLKTNPMMWPPLELAKDYPQILENVMSIGFDHGYLVVFNRRVATIVDEDIIVDGPLVPGMSGGPVVNLEGKVVGLNQSTSDAIGLACGTKEIKNFLESKAERE